MADVAIIGAGSWGIALAKVLHTNGNKVTVWSIAEDEITMLKEKHEHVQKLPGVKLPEDMEFTTDLESAVSGKAYLILAVPSVFTRSTAKSMAPFVKEGQIIVCVAKGIEEETLMPLTDIVEQEIPQAEVAVMCGPSHAEEVGIGLPTTVVQSGGPTAVINSSLYGVVSEGMRHPEAIEHVYGMINGIEVFLNGTVLDFAEALP